MLIVIPTGGIMAKINICERCKINKATVQLTSYDKGLKKDLILCENCAKNFNEKNEKNDHNISDFTKENFMSSLLDSIQNTGFEVNNIKTTKCEKCGMNYGEFKEIGRLGCDECYEIFSEKLIPLIQRLQGSTVHTGKVSRKVKGILEIKREINDIRDKMNLAIQKEQFEEAAVLRDKIKALEKGMNKAGGFDE